MEFDELVRSVQSLGTEDGLRVRFDLAQWRTLGGFMAPQTVKSGELLITQGEVDRSVYFLGQGSMQVYAGRSHGSSRLVMLRPGALIGESGLFSDGPHTASVEAMSNCVVWALRYPRFQELAQRSPQIALEFMRGAGSVLVTRVRQHTAGQAAAV